MVVKYNEQNVRSSSAVTTRLSNKAAGSERTDERNAHTITCEHLAGGELSCGESSAIKE